MSRSWPIPRPERTLGIFGDQHWGLEYDNDRLGATALRDLLDSPLIPSPAAWIHVGDIEDNWGSFGQTARDTAQAWLANFEDREGRPPFVSAGNHDNGLGSSLALWEAAYGPSKYTQDLWPGARLVVVSPRVNMTIQSAGLTFLEDALAEGDEDEVDCIIVSHCPIYDTHGALSPREGQGFESTDIAFYAQSPQADSHEVTDILNAHPCAKAWISGHTHAGMDSPDMVMTKDIGARDIVCVNTSAMTWTSAAYGYDDPIRMVFVTYREDTGEIEVRCRNNGAGIWDSPYANNTVGVAREPIPA